MTSKRIIISMLAACALTGTASADYDGESLLAFWPLDETNPSAITANDASGNGNHGELKSEVWVFDPLTGPAMNTAGPTINSVQVNAAEFDASNDVLFVNDSASLDWDKTTGSISFWLNVDLDNRMSILRTVSDGSYEGMALEKTGSSASAAYRVFFTPNVDQAAYFMTEYDPTPNVWEHYVFTWDYAAADSGDTTNPNRVKCYVNGVQTLNRVSSGASGDAGFTIPPTITGDWIFGQRHLGADVGAGTTRPFDGEMAEIAVYSDVLTAGEAADLFSLGVNTGDANLVSYWNFSEGSGTSIADETANANTMITSEPVMGYENGGATWATASADTGKPDYVTQSLHFNGANNFLTIPADAIFDFTEGSTIPAQGTIVMWTNLDHSNRTGIIGDESGAFVAQISSSSRMALNVGNSSAYLQTSSGLVTPDMWVHYAFVFDRSQAVGTTAVPNRIKIYRNGVALTGATANLDASFTTDPSPTNWVIGRRHVISDNVNPRWLSGEVADVAIFKAALTDAEILAMAQTSDGPGGGGVLNYLATSVPDWSILTD